MANNNRIESIDWLRGLMALSIMLYHYFCWLFFELDSSTILGRLGIYGVSIFFILSGLSMAIVYNGYIKDIQTSIFFFVKRIFRIWPLLWIAIFFMVFYIMLISNQTYSIVKVFLNLTTLFGFVKPGEYINTGAWSIGNEMVYYALTPIIIILYNKKKIFGNLVLLFTWLVGLYFSQFVLVAGDSLANQWLIYINPFNNLFLYVSGIAIFYNLNKFKIKTHLNLLMICICCALFAFLPYEGNQITIVSGTGRIVFSTLSILLVILFYKINCKLPKIIEYPLERLGIATYSVYLLHPIMMIIISLFFVRILNLNDPIMIFASAISATIIISLVSYKYFETRFINFGKKITNIKKVDRKYLAN